MRTKQPGMGGAPAEALRYSVGDMPTRSRKRELKEPTLSNPTRKQISVMVKLASRSRSLARSIRRRVERGLLSPANPKASQDSENADGTQGWRKDRHWRTASSRR